MSRDHTIQFMGQISKTPNAFQLLEENVQAMSREALSEELLHCGIIPESYSHDSSEEKLWAKYCDILLAKALSCLNIETTVLRTRGNSADVFGKAPDYTIVGDAKAFRLSRTAKNQKDFKVSALDDWRKQDTFACLVAPLYQFPTSKSQVYLQAIAKNVTLLSYIHLKFLLDHPPHNSLIGLWSAPKSIAPSDIARNYWQAIDALILSSTGTSFDDLKTWQRMEIERTKEIGQEGIAHWQTVIASYNTLSREEAIKALIQSEKIEEKIQTIEHMIARDVVI